MTRVTVQDGKLVIRDGKIGTGPGCCCDRCNCSSTGYAPAVESVSGRGLVWLEFSSCIGSGASGTVDAPPAVSPCDYAGLAGPITGATLTSGGAGYARLGRVQPTVSASAGGGSGAVLSVVLAEQVESLGEGCMQVPYWAVESVSVINGGSGFADAIPVSFSTASGDTAASHATAYAYVEIAAPTSPVVTVDSSGSGAVLVPAWQENGTAGRGGSVNPPFCEKPSRAAYEVTGFTIANGGSGYAVDDLVEIAFSSNDYGSVAELGSFAVDAVDGNGAITAIRIDYSGRYGGSFTGSLAHVVVEGCTDGGAGKYYREDPTAPPYVADVAVTVHQEAPSSGNGAAITATVDDDPASANFGKIVSLTVVNGGSGYLSPSFACGDLSTLYINWGAVTTSINSKGTQGFVGTVCGFRFRENDGDIDGTEGPYCRGGVVNPFVEDAGNTANFQFLLDGSGIECKCGGYLHMTFTLAFWCDECIAVTSGFGEFTTQTVQPLLNKTRYRTLCVRFPKDEDGCPVGDAEIVGWSVGDLFVVEPLPGNNACRPYYKHDGTYVSNDPCNCPTECDENIEPQISFMP